MVVATRQKALFPTGENAGIFVVQSADYFVLFSYALKNTFVITVALVLALASCVVRPPRGRVPNAEGFSMVKGYVDLQPGWRVRVVTPVTKSGVLKVVTETSELSGNTLSVKATDDFVGYEVSYYSVKARPEGGIVIEFNSATVFKGGKTNREPRPLVGLFDLPDNLHFARLLFLTRVSQADHDQGIVAATSMQRLQAITEQVQADPVHNCKQDEQTFCSWIPAGIAVQPEEKRVPDRNKPWTPAM